MQAQEIIKKPIGILKSSNISDVIRKLLENNVSRLIVLDGGKPIGIITEKDVGLFLFSESTQRGIDKIPLERIMNKIEHVKQDESLDRCAQIMIDKKISSLAVGTDDSLQGIFTKTDLVNYYISHNSGDQKIIDFMTHDYIFTHTAAPLYKVVRKMLENKVSRIIVKNQSEEAVGVISFRDLFRISLELGSQGDDSLSELIRTGFLSEDGFGGVSLARDVMSKGIITVRFNEGLELACNLMIEENVSGLAVLDGNNSITGIISKTDVIRAMTS
jgi:CBS domain-containing protein